jgi:hypothetical protein
MIEALHSSIHLLETWLGSRTYTRIFAECGNELESTPLLQIPRLLYPTTAPGFTINAQ